MDSEQRALEFELIFHLLGFLRRQFVIFVLLLLFAILLGISGQLGLHFVHAASLVFFEDSRVVEKISVSLRDHRGVQLPQTDVVVLRAGGDEELVIGRLANVNVSDPILVADQRVQAVELEDRQTYWSTRVDSSHQLTVEILTLFLFSFSLWSCTWISILWFS